MTRWLPPVAETPPALDPQRVDVLGVHVSAASIPRAVERIGQFIRESAKTYVCVTSVHGVVESLTDPALRNIHNQSGLTTTDGMPLVWSARYAGHDAERVYGPDLMLALCERAALEGWSSYFYGAAPGVADELASNLEARFSGFKTVGTLSPPFRPLTDEEMVEIDAEINAAKPDIVWVGLSTPKQERWMAAHRDTLDASVLIGVGAAFDFHAGKLRQAPPRMQRMGLEWLFRLAVEPRRLWRRYLVQYPPFVWKILRRPPKTVG